MRFVTSAQRHISAFVSHSEENNDEAKYYEAILREAGFSVFQYGHGLNPGEHIRRIVLDRISKCHFFLLLVSEHSLTSSWVQRELGLAVALRKKNRDYKPIIIPLYVKNASWRESGERPVSFPTRDFDSGETCEPFDLAGVRGLDRHSNPYADSDDVLISLMKPSILVTRLDFQDEATFYDMDVFRLYDSLFPPVERDAAEDIIHWVLRSDIGQERTIVLPDGAALTYALDSRFFILSLAEKAIGLAFFTFDLSSKLLYGNYIAVQECWRGGDIAGAFMGEIMSVLGERFPDNQGVVFEVERFERQRIERIIDDLERTRSFSSEDDRNEIRKFLRVAWYQKIGCLFFLDKRTGEPLFATSPSLDPSGSVLSWKGTEVDYWIMWCNKPGAPLSIGGAKVLWERAVKCIYLEILGKSLVESAPDTGPEYWSYARTVVDNTLKHAEPNEITFGKFLYRHSSLFERWMKLRIEIAI